MERSKQLCQHAVMARWHGCLVVRSAGAVRGASQQPPGPGPAVLLHIAEHRAHQVDQVVDDALIGCGGQADLAAACGFPGKLDVAGVDVANMWLAGHTAEIVAYNGCDALPTHLLMLFVGLHTGRLTPAHYARELDAVAALVWQQISRGQEHFRKFWTAWQGEAAAPKLATSTARREQLHSRWPECVAAVRATVGVPAAVGLRATKDIIVAGDSVFLCFADDRSRRLVANRQDAVATRRRHPGHARVEPRLSGTNRG